MLGYWEVLRSEKSAPAEKRKREMASDDLKICCVARNHSCADATGSECDQNIEGQVSQFIGLVVLVPSDGIQEVRCMDPLPLGRREDLTPIHQIDHKPSLDSRPGATQQFMHHDRRAPDDKWRPEDLGSETGGSKVFNVDRGIENGKLSCV